MGVSERQAKKYIKRFTEKGLLKREGSNRIGQWVIADENLTYTPKKSGVP
ncbi:MAG: hypothetical protein SOZ80_03710 [Prevotella sp.]|nr:hypothetical protein [Prevotella sp.]MDD7317263.1 hypothetical protein [Prevotellaceae bacterium]MDY4019867.1 hypothetical protein [Prevotella sp.]